MGTGIRIRGLHFIVTNNIRLLGLYAVHSALFRSFGRTRWCHVGVWVCSGGWWTNVVSLTVETITPKRRNIGHFRKTIVTIMNVKTVQLNTFLDSRLCTSKSCYGHWLGTFPSYLIISYYNNHRSWKASFNNPRIIVELRYTRKTKQYCCINLG